MSRYITMKLIMIFVFSYSLDVLTLMADKTPEFDKTETSTWDTAWPSEQSSNSLGSQDRFPSRQKRGLIKSCTGYIIIKPKLPHLHSAMYKRLNSPYSWLG